MYEQRIERKRRKREGRRKRRKEEGRNMVKGEKERMREEKDG